MKNFWRGAILMKHEARAFYFFFQHSPLHDRVLVDTRVAKVPLGEHWRTAVLAHSEILVTLASRGTNHGDDGKYSEKTWRKERNTDGSIEFRRALWRLNVTPPRSSGSAAIKKPTQRWRCALCLPLSAKKAGVIISYKGTGVGLYVRPGVGYEGK